MVALFNALGRINGAIASVDGIPATDTPYRADGHVDSFDDADFYPAEVVYFFTNGTTAASADFAKIDTHKVMI
jgi:hypothetical protein